MWIEWLMQRCLLLFLLLRNVAMLIKSNWFMRSGYVAANPFFLLLEIYILFAAHHWGRITQLVQSNWFLIRHCSMHVTGSSLVFICPWREGGVDLMECVLFAVCAIGGLRLIIILSSRFCCRMNYYYIAKTQATNPTQEVGCGWRR